MVPKSVISESIVVVLAHLGSCFSSWDVSLEQNLTQAFRWIQIDINISLSLSLFLPLSLSLYMYIYIYIHMTRITTAAYILDMNMEIANLKLL